MIDISVIIVNYNTKEVTASCVDSVYEHTKDIDFEIILVDNASTDGSKERFAKDTRVKYIYSNINGGFGYGNNLGMRHARGKYLFLLNSDTLLVNNALKLFYDYAESHDPNGVYGCYLKDDSGNDCTSFFNFPAFTFKDFLKRISNFDQETTPAYTEKDVDAITGADMFIPRTVLDVTGGFNENIFLYGEEGELQYRMMKKGFNRRILHTPQIIHLEGTSSGGKNKIKNKYLKSHFITLKVHMPYWKYFIVRIYYFLNLFIRSILCGVWLSPFVGKIKIDERLNAPDVSFRP